MNSLPAIIATRHSERLSEIDLVVNLDNPWFEGHFPVQPILPGVVQIGWAVHFAASLCAMPGEVHALEQIKFRRPILPGAKLTLALVPSAGREKLRFEYRDVAGCYSSGILDFRSGA